MTKEKIQYILSTHGYEMDKWSDFSDISIFFLGQDSAVYTNKADRLYRFNSATECLETVFGSHKNGNFVSSEGETDSTKFIPHEFREFNLIHGMISSVERYGVGGMIKKKI